MKVLLIGSDSSRPRARGEFERVDAQLTERIEIAGELAAFDLICVLLDHPDQYAPEDVRRLLGSCHGTRLFCVRGAWCASLLRSRTEWPAAVVVDEAGFERRVDQEVAILRGECPAIPITAGLEEVAAFNHDWLKRLLIVMALFVGPLSGCRKPPEAVPPAPKDAPPSPAEVKEEPKAAWADQVKAVRAGTSNRIDVKTVSAKEWSDLATDCGALEVLEVENAVLTPADFEILLTLPKLRRLKIGGSPDDASAEVLGRHPKITQLLVSSDWLTDRGVAALCRLPLVQLRLQAQKVTDAAAAEFLKLEQLRFLHLIDVPLTDAALPELAKLKKLESLYLDGARCTDHGLAELLKARPDLHFHRDQSHLRGDPGKDGH